MNYEKDAAGIVLLTLDDNGRSANTCHPDFLTALANTIARLEADTTLTGVIITSAKPTFLLGADPDTRIGRNAQTLFDTAEGFKALLRRLELLGKPVVAAVNGTALGGGLELALACHHRIVVDDGRIQLGFPEVGWGLLPSGGGIARTVRLLGLEKGLAWLTQNHSYTPQQALTDGLIHALASDTSDLLAQARAWIAAHPQAQAPWDAVKHFKIPGGGPASPRIAQLLAVAPAMMRQQTRGNYPAPHAILSAAVEGAQVDFATACRIESRYFANIAAGPVAHNLINAFWTNLNDIKNSSPDLAAAQSFNGMGWGEPLQNILSNAVRGTVLAAQFASALSLSQVRRLVDNGRIYTARGLAAWLLEGLTLLAEGQPPQAIEMASLQAGMPLGPLALLDALSLDVVAAELLPAAQVSSDHPAADVIDQMRALGRTGRAAKAGFYDYNEDSQCLWPGLADHYEPAAHPLPQPEMIDRILFMQVLTAVASLADGVVGSEAAANLGSILGWGFAPCHGGAAQFIRAYGVGAFVQRAHLLAQQYGDRFAPPLLDTWIASDA